MRLAEFTAPGQNGEAEAEIVAYYFGPDQGGDVAANTERWTQQFFDESGGHPEADVRTMDGAPFPTAIVTLEGSYARAIGMAAGPTEAVPDQMLVAAVVETPRGNFYIQLHGPAATVRAHTADFLDFVQRIRPVEPART